jgi:hypothetical protein
VDLVPRLKDQRRIDKLTMHICIRGGRGRVREREMVIEHEIVVRQEQILTARKTRMGMLYLPSRKANESVNRKRTLIYILTIQLLNIIIRENGSNYGKCKLTRSPC